ncbi:MAG: hypothetical protein M3Y48_15170 [Actinomycetota bacterium]|nr:hypothetical protein [Actinomycetota bacterium]
MIDSSAAAAQALCDYFLANAERGDHGANDELIAELVRRIRAGQVMSVRADAVPGSASAAGD